MRVILILGWLLLPIGFGIWHFGPGQEMVQLDEVARLLAEADDLAAAQKWAKAEEKYAEALKRLPSGKVDEGRRIRLELARAQMQGSELPAAHRGLKGLCEELQDDKAVAPELLADARSTLAQSQYYMTWLMRLEGLPREEWEPEIEASRQNYRLLAEGAETAGDAEGQKKHQEDLESAVRLARMDLSELQGLPLPSQCKCKCCGSCKSKRPGKGQKPASKPQDARGASSGPPPDGSGH
jgi:hypothetical protein